MLLTSDSVMQPPGCALQASSALSYVPGSKSPSLIAEPADPVEGDGRAHGLLDVLTVFLLRPLQRHARVAELVGEADIADAQVEPVLLAARQIEPGKVDLDRARQDGMGDVERVLVDVAIRLLDREDDVAVAVVAGHVDLDRHLVDMTPRGCPGRRRSGQVVARIDVDVDGWGDGRLRRVAAAAGIRVAEPWHFCPRDLVHVDG